MPREWLLRLWGTIRRRRSDDDLENELRLHVELAAEAARLRGLSADEAAREARRQSGGLAQSMEAIRGQRGFPWLEDLARDIRYGCRMLARSPGFTVVAVISLAIGIGANGAAFSFADALLLRPLPVPRPTAVLTIGSADRNRESQLLSYREYRDIRDRSTTFDGLTAFITSVATAAIDAHSTPRMRIGMLVSGNFFSVMQIEPQLGRVFRPDEDEVPGRDPVVIISHELWEQQFRSDETVLGRSIQLNGIELTVIGVAPPDFTGLDQYTRFEFYAPLMMWPRLVPDSARLPLDEREYRELTVKGRLKAGISLSQAQSELSVLAADLERANPETDRNRRLILRTELASRIAQAPPIAALTAMLVALAGAVLLVACANVAGLLSSRSPTRAREVAMRLAIGAGRGRVVRQLVTESVLIATLGGIAGLGLAYAGITLFRQVRIPTELPIAATFDIDRRVLLVSFGAALLSAVIFGLTPALRSTRTDLTSVLKGASPGWFGRRPWGRALLVVTQVAIAVVLLVVATFIYNGFAQRLSTGPGFRTERLLMLLVDPAASGYKEAQTLRFFEQLADRARLAPGVRSAALTSYMPLDGTPPTLPLVPEGFQFPAGVDSVSVSVSAVDERYFDTLDLPILAGRAFARTDSREAPRVAIINEVMAQRYWPDQNPLGKRFRLNDGSGAWVELVGVAKTAKYDFLTETPRPFLYLPFRQHRSSPPRPMFLIAEAAGDPTTLVSTLEQTVRSLDGSLPVSNLRTVDEFYRLRVVTILNVIRTLIGAMGIMGLALALVGLYGLVAYTASRRTKEIGIRMAIGANRSDVVQMVLRQGITLAVAGLLIGLVASIGADRALAAMFAGGPGGDNRTDLAAYVLVSLTVLAVTLLAAYVPARRAARINPTDALRCD